MTNTTSIPCDNPEQRLMALKVIVALGGRIHGNESLSPEEFDDKYHYYTYPDVKVDDTQKGKKKGKKSFYVSCHKNNGFDTEMTLGEWVNDTMENIVAPNPKVVLNDEYTAEVLPDKTVQVGCQIIAGEKILELANLLK